MRDVSTTRILYVICAIAFVVIIVRALLNVKGPEDFEVTVTPAEVQAYARTQLSGLQERSFAGDVELCGIIFEDSEGELGTTGLLEGERASCDIAYFDEPGMAPVASFHTHGAYGDEYDSEVPSVLDMESDISSRMDGYISTPGGRFWRIDWQSRTAEQICGEGCLAQDPDYQACAAFEPDAEYTISSLRQRFMTSPSDC